jgi:hypothetical protein
MSDDPDLPKANYALQVLRQARLSRNETAARMVEHLGVCDDQHRVTDPRNRGNSASRQGRNFRVGECSQRRRVCWAHSLESRAQSYRELDRIVDLRSGNRCARKRPTLAGLRGANLHAE